MHPAAARRPGRRPPGAARTACTHTRIACVMPAYLYSLHTHTHSRLATSTWRAHLKIGCLHSGHAACRCPAPPYGGPRPPPGVAVLPRPSARPAAGHDWVRGCASSPRGPRSWGRPPPCSTRPGAPPAVRAPCPGAERAVHCRIQSRQKACRHPSTTAKRLPAAGSATLSRHTAQSPASGGATTPARTASRARPNAVLSRHPARQASRSTRSSATASSCDGRPGCCPPGAGGGGAGEGVVGKQARAAEAQATSASRRAAARARCGRQAAARGIAPVCMCRPSRGALGPPPATLRDYACLSVRGMFTT